MWSTATEVTMSSLPLKHRVSMDHIIFVELKPENPSSLPDMSVDRLNSLDWKHEPGQSPCILASDFPQLYYVMFVCFLLHRNRQA